MNKKNIATIAKKELRSFFNNPTAYVIAVAFLLLWEFLFFRSVFLIEQASLRGLFDLLPWLLIVIIPALTMGSLAEEENEGTLEFLLTRPVSQLELVLGKYLGITAFFSTILLFVFPLAVSLSQYGNLDWGQLIAQYIAAVLTVSVLVSLGIMISSLLKSQITAFLISAAASFFLAISGTELVSARLPLFFAPFLEQLSFSNHFSSMSRGVIDLRDFWYFLSLSGVFLGFTYLNLLKNKFGNRKEAYRSYQTGALLLVGIVILSNVVGSRIPGRIDLTEEKIYTLSPTTSKIASELPDLVNISFYASDKLPAQLQPILRDTRDILSDYQTASKGKILVTNKNPSTDEKIAQEAVSSGIQPMRFNVVSQEELQVKEGYLGLAVSYGGKTEVIPFIQNINDLEYQLSSFLLKLTKDNKAKLGFLSGHGEKSLYADYRALNEELGKQFEIVPITAKSKNGETESPNSAATPKKENEPDGEKTFTIADDIGMLIVAGPTENFSEEEKETISEFVKKGGNLMLLVDGVVISPQTMAASANPSNISEIVEELTGVKIKKDLAYDLKANETVGFGGGVSQFFLPYPFWIRAQRAQNATPITAKIESVILPWASTLEADSGRIKEKGFGADELFSTTEFAGSQGSSFNIAPDQKFSQQGLSKRLLAVALTSSGEADQSKVVILGDSDFLGDQFAGDNANNLSFALETVSWLSEEQVLSKIGIKNYKERKLSFEDKSQPNVLKFGNLAFVFFSISVYGSWRLMKRKKMSNRIYGE